MLPLSGSISTRVTARTTSVPSRCWYQERRSGSPWTWRSSTRAGLGSTPWAKRGSMPSPRPPSSAEAIRALPRSIPGNTVVRAFSRPWTTEAPTTSTVAPSSSSAATRSRSPGVEGGAEGVEGGGHRCAIGLDVGVGELAPAAVKGGLHRADGGGEDVGDVLEGHVEGVLEHHRRPLLGRELDQERPGGLANVAGRCTALRVRRWRRGRAAAHPVDPEVRGHAEHPGPQVSRRFLERAERGERPGERVLHQVLGVPGAPGEVPAVPVERGPERLNLFLEIAPDGLDGARGRVVVHAGKTGEKAGRIRPARRRGARRGGLGSRRESIPTPTASDGHEESQGCGSGVVCVSLKSIAS